jgi:hypothetical protein
VPQKTITAAPTRQSVGASVKNRRAPSVHLGRHQPCRDEDAERHQDGVVDLAEHWNEIRHEVDRTHDVGDNHQHESLGVPRHSRIARCKMDGMDVAAQGLSSVAYPIAEPAAHEETHT